jgi:hypothetical protein
LGSLPESLTCSTSEVTKIPSTAPWNGGVDGEVAASILSVSATHAVWTKKANNAAQNSKRRQRKPLQQSQARILPLKKEDLYTIICKTLQLVVAYAQTWRTWKSDLLLTRRSVVRKLSTPLPIESPASIKGPMD